MSSTAAEARQLAVISDYDGLIAAIRTRVDEMQLHGGRFDEFAGLPIGYLSKLTAPNPMRRIGMTSLGPLLQALGVKIALLEDPEATQRLKNGVKPRDAQQVHPSRTHYVMTNRRWRQIQKKGSAARWKNTTPEERSQAAQRAALARWHGAKAAEDTSPAA